MVVPVVRGTWYVVHGTWYHMVVLLGIPGYVHIDVSCMYKGHGKRQGRTARSLGHSVVESVMARTGEIFGTGQSSIRLSRRCWGLSFAMPIPSYSPSGPHPFPCPSQHHHHSVTHVCMHLALSGETSFSYIPCTFPSHPDLQFASLVASWNDGQEEGKRSSRSPQPLLEIDPDMFA